MFKDVYREIRKAPAGWQGNGGTQAKVEVVCTRLKELFLLDLEKYLLPAISCSVRISSTSGVEEALVLIRDMKSNDSLLI